jgi:DNA recombination protein RmuC
MKSLSQKAYWSQFDRSPEFVVMVVPYDSGLTAAFERDGKLLEDALENKVLIVSPVSLLALLKVIAYGWLQLQLAENAQKIAEQGKELYNRFLTFSGHLSEVGKKMSSTVQSYNKAVGSLESRILPSIQRLKEMGAGSGQGPEITPVDSQPRELSGIPEENGD